MEEKRLSLNFHQTFIPERRYISEILELSQLNKKLTFEEIKENTSIPTGKSSGKINPTINYAKGMGFITVLKTQNSYSLQSTLLGKSVFQQDKYLSEDLTQWLAHIFLARKNEGAEIWYRLFSKSSSLLGNSFSREELNEYFESYYGKKKRSLIGPLISTYNSEDSLGNIKCLKETNGLINRFPLPAKENFSLGCAALFIHYWEYYFKSRQQITLSEYEEKTHYFDLMGWSDEQIHLCLNWFEEYKVINIDRQLGSPVLSRLTDFENIVIKVFDPLF